MLYLLFLRKREEKEKKRADHCYYIFKNKSRTIIYFYLNC